MTMRRKTAAALAAFVLLSVAAAPLLSGQAMDDKDRLLFQKYRMTRPDLVKAQEQLKKKQVDKAEQSLLKVLAQMPENAEASFYLAEVCYQKGEFERGLAAILDAETNFPVIQKALYRRQMGTITQGGEDRADLQNEILAQQQKTGEPITAATAKMKEQAGQSQSSAQDLKSEVLSIPAEYSYVHGNLLFRLKRFEEALAEFEKAVVADPKHGRALNNIANIYYMARQYERSLEYIGRAESVGAKVNPDFKRAVLQALGK